MRRAFRNTRLRPRKANASAMHVWEGLHVGLPAWNFNARTRGLVPSRNSDARKILLRSLSPEYADGTLTQSM